MAWNQSSILALVSLRTAEPTRPDKSEVRRLCGANGRLRELTGWAPGMSLEQGLAETVAWFREQGSAADGARYAV